MNPLIAVGLALIGLYVLSGVTTAGTAERLKYTFKSISFDTQGVFNIRINVTIGIQNPTGNGFSIQSFVGDLFVNDYNIGNISNFTPTVISANSETPYTISLLVNVFGLPAAIASLIQNFTGFRAVLDGTLTVDGLSIPLNLSKNF